jgi:MATE family multidrug resistance protein
MISLALPVVLGELGWMAMGVVDTMMVGRVGAEALAGMSVGRAVFFGVGLFGIGLLLGMDTLVAQAFGRGDVADCRASLLQGLYLAAILTPPVVGMLWAVRPLFAWWGIDHGIVELAVPYLEAVSWSVLPILVYTAFRRYLQAVNLVRPVMLALVSANVINALGDWVLVFGKLGFPALGAAGAGWTTGLASGYMALFLIVAFGLHLRRDGGALRLPWRGPDMHRLRRLVALGLPAATQIVLEYGVFGLATLLAGRLDAVSLAAHQIALTAASVTFMVPLGISSAAAVRVGHAVGRGDGAGAGRAGWTALLLGSGFMLLAAVVFVLFPAAIARIFTVDARVVAMGVTLLYVAAVFQLFDGLQVVATGALRGSGDTRSPMVMNLVGHWLVGLPVGAWLCFGQEWGVGGLWIGLSIGLILVGTILLVVWSRRTRMPPGPPPARSAAPA